MRNVIDYLEEKGLRDQVKIMIGGAPTTMAFAREIGTDAYSDMVFDAMEAIDDLVAGKRGMYSARD